LLVIASRSTGLDAIMSSIVALPARAYCLAGGAAAGGSSIESRRLMSGIVGIRTTPRVGRSRSNVTRSRQRISPAASRTGSTPRPRIAREGASSPSATAAKVHLQGQHRIGNATVQGDDPDRLHVDHVVESLDVQS